MSTPTAPSDPLQPLYDNPSRDLIVPNMAAATATSANSDTATPPISEQAPTRTSPWLALRYRDFRLMWSGNFVSQLGTQMQMVAVGIQLWDITHDFTAIGLRGVFKLVPVLVLSLFGGVIADALDRRKLLMLTQTTMGLVSATLAAATLFGWVSAPLIYGLTALAATAVAFDNPARSSLTPNLVPRQHLPNALSLNIIMWQIATIFGPMVAAQFLPLHATGFGIIYLIDALSFGGTIVALALLRSRTQQAETRNVSFKAAVDGLRFLRKAPILMSTMTLDFFATFLGAAMVLLPPLLERVLHVSRDAQVFGFLNTWGLLYAAPAAGALVAGLIMSWLGNVRRQGWIVLVSVGAYGLATVLFGLSNAFWLTALALAGTGAADTVSMVMRQTIRQLSTPDDLRGRMTSVSMIFYMGGPQLGELEAGLAANVFGLGPSIAIGGAAVMAVTAITGLVVSTLRNYDRDPGTAT